MADEYGSPLPPPLAPTQAVGASATGAPVAMPGDASGIPIAVQMDAIRNRMGSMQPSLPPPPPQAAAAAPKKRSALRNILIGVLDSIALSQGFPTSRDYEERDRRMDMQERKTAVDEQEASMRKQQLDAAMRKIAEDNKIISVDPLLKFAGFSQDEIPKEFMESSGDGKIGIRSKNVPAFLQAAMLGRMRAREGEANRQSREGIVRYLEGGRWQRHLSQQTFTAEERLRDRQLRINLANQVNSRVMRGLFVPMTDKQGRITGFYNNRNPGLVVKPSEEGMRRAGISGEELANQASGEVLLGQISKVRELATVREDSLGPAAGRIGGLRSEFVGDDPEAADLYQTVDDMKNQLVYMLSGKQINEQEYKRLRDTMPGRNLPAATFHVRLNNFEQRLSEVLERRMGAVPNPPTIPRGTAAPTSQSPEGTVIKMKDGSTRVKKNGQWVSQ